MGVIPKVDQPSPAFIHVDVDDLWAIAECYGITVAEEWHHHVTTDALPRFAQLFCQQNIKATFFLVGRDLEYEPYVENVRRLLASGHAVANHSYSHSLSFRAMDSPAIAAEIEQTHELARAALGVTLKGFRAPGYGWSPGLMRVLDEKGYRYDASLMPGPYGGVFRWMDGRICNHYGQKGTSPTVKTQYPRFSDTWHSLFPAPVTGTGLVRIPSATSGLLRLPFQAGVCMRLGWPYFRSCFEPYRWNPALPFVFLFHVADLCDFSSVPHDLFRRSSFFNSSVEQRLELAGKFLAKIQQERPVILTEDWLRT